VGYNAASDNMG